MPDTSLARIAVGQVTPRPPGTTLFDLVHSTASACKLPVWETQLGSQQRRPLFDLVEGVPRHAPCGPAAATQHPVPVTLRDPMHLEQRADVSRDAVVAWWPRNAALTHLEGTTRTDPYRPDLGIRLVWGFSHLGFVTAKRALGHGKNGPEHLR
jgi:hypothetical protein